MSEKAKHDDTTLDHVLKYTGLFGGVQGINILIGVVRNKLASKILGAAGLGLLGLYNAFADFINSSSNLGLPISSVQRLSELFEQGDASAIRSFISVVRTWCLWSSCFAVVLCLVAAVFKDPTLALLAPMLVGVIITGGEVSLLKGLRRLQRVAVVSLLAALMTFCFTIPFFWLMGTRGIILSLDSSALAVMTVHLCFTLPLYPWRVSPFSREVFRAGLPLLRIGIPYVLTGVIGAGVSVLLLDFLKEHSSEATLGYYRAGYTIMVTYAGIIFTALEPDYFPRLSSVNHDVVRRNLTINRQIRACLLLLSPMLIVLIVSMPILLPLLYTEEFLPAVGMTVCAAFYMFFRCLSVPIAYMALARGDSKMYMIMETVYDLFLLAAIVGFYLLWGLNGIGVGLSASALFDFILVGSCYRRLYAFRLERSTWFHTLVQGLLLGSAVLACLLLPPVWKYIAGSALFVLSLACSYRVLLRESHLVQRLHQRFLHRR